jgi:hypothetical protein
MASPEETTKTEDHSELEAAAHALLEALARMYGSVYLSENVQKARTELRELLHRAPEPDPADAAFVPPANDAEAPEPAAEPVSEPPAETAVEAPEPAQEATPPAEAPEAAETTEAPQ